MDKITETVYPEGLEQELQEFRPFTHGDGDEETYQIIHRFLEMNGIVMTTSFDETGCIDGWKIKRVGGVEDDYIHVATASEALNIALTAIKYDAHWKGKNEPYESYEEGL